MSIMHPDVNASVSAMSLDNGPQLMAVDEQEAELSFEEALSSAQAKLSTATAELRNMQTKSANLELKIDEGGYDSTQDSALLVTVTNAAERLQERVNKFKSMVNRLEASQPVKRAPKELGDTNESVTSGEERKVILDDSIPRFGPVYLGKGRKYKVLDVAMEFLEGFQSQAKNIHGSTFDRICHRLLQQAVLEEGPRTRLEHALSNMNGKGVHETNWEACEFLFINTLMTDSEKGLEVRTLIANGIRSGESFERYSWRLQTLVKIYKVGTSSMHAVSLRQMVLSIPPGVFDTMKARAVYDITIEAFTKNV